MKVKNNIEFVFVACVVMIVLTVFSTQVFAQCTTCAPSNRVPGAITCQPNSSGGQECQAQGDTCTLAGVCRPPRDIPPGEDGSSFASKLDAKPEIEPSLIKQIAETHPRFAFALATLVKNGTLGKDGVRIYIVPKPITIEDVEKTLASEQPTLLPTEANSLSSSKRKVRKQEKVIPVIYEISFQDTKLVLSVVQGTSLDSAYTKLEVDFAEVPALTGETKMLKATNWRVN